MSLRAARTGALRIIASIRDHLSSPYLRARSETTSSRPSSTKFITTDEPP
jgi:hypothetical protein